MTEFDTVLAENLRLALVKKGVTQAALATHLGIGRSKMSEVLAGRTSLTATELFQASRFFGVETDWFAEPHLIEVASAA